MTALILQGRLNSTRLPQKSLLPLEGEPLIFRVMEALNAVPCDIRILACPESCAAPFGPLAEKAGFVIHTGSDEDVLARYCAAIRRYSPDRVIRATGDNPFVFADAAKTLAEEAAAVGADYAGYTGLPLGAGVEVVNAEALLRAEKESTTREDREHVCPYLYGHGELFLLHRPLAPPPWQAPRLRLTVDTLEDYHRAQKLYRRLSKKTSSMNSKSPERYEGKTILEAAGT
jgi:spore coat polysaccharide biosynthesis protein SpsF